MLMCFGSNCRGQLNCKPDGSKGHNKQDKLRTECFGMVINKLIWGGSLA